MPPVETFRRCRDVAWPEAGSGERRRRAGGMTVVTVQPGPRFGDHSVHLPHGCGEADFWCVVLQVLHVKVAYQFSGVGFQVVDYRRNHTNYCIRIRLIWGELRRKFLTTEEK